MWRALKALAARPAWHGAAFLVLAAAVLFAHLGEGHLANYDDCYYAEKAKEMVRDGHWITPHYAGVPRLDNAPLFLWLMGLAFLGLGVSNYAAILFSTLSGVLCIAVVHRIALRLGAGAFGAFTAAFVLLTTQYFQKYARHAMFDVFLTLLFLLAVERYLAAREDRPRQWLWIGLLAGLGVLTKSVLGLFPLALCLLHLVLTRGVRALRNPWPWLALLVCAATFLPWYAYHAATYGDRFYAEHVRWLLWDRAFVLQPEKRTLAGYFDYVWGIAQIYWPWLPLALAGMWSYARAGRSARDTAILLGLWLLIVIGVMSLANEKKLWYVMTVFPCLALLCARAAEQWIRSPETRERMMAAGFGFLILLAAVLNATPIGVSRARRPDLQTLALVARANLPPGEKVANLDQDYWATNNQFLFYSDHELWAPVFDPARVRAHLDAGGTALLTTSGARAVDTGAAAGRYAALARSGDLALVRRAPAGVPMLPAGPGLGPLPDSQPRP